MTSLLLSSLLLCVLLLSACCPSFLLPCTVTNLLQWNCRGVRSSFQDLQSLIYQHFPAVLCLQETKLAPGASFHINNYITFRKDLPSDTIAHGGVLLAVHRSIPAKQIVLVTDLQAVAARVRFNRRYVTLCTVYLPPGVPLPAAELRRLAADLQPPFLIMGDFNSHHTSWGCATTNRRGRLVERFIIDESLCILNTGTRTHVTLPSGHTSAIDLSLSSPELTDLLAWDVSDNPLSSDHFPIILKYRDGPILGKRPPRWNLRKADWSEFTSKIEVALSAAPADGQELNAVDLTALLLRAAEGSIPRTSGFPRRAPVPWWTDACRDAIRARERAYRTFDRASTTVNAIEFRRARAAARRTMRAAKKASWRAYVSSLNRFTPTSRIWERIKRISGQLSSSPLPRLRIRGEDVLDPLQVANEIGRSLSDVSQDSLNNPDFVRFKEQSELSRLNFFTSELFLYNKPFTLTEITSAISSLRSVAEGPDGIHNEMLRHLPRCAVLAVLSLFNRIWQEGEFPPAWREATIIPILKPGKTGEDPLHYRPISLTSSLCKLMEKMVNIRLSWYLESNSLFTNAQCGFRKGRSALDHILSLDTAVRRSFHERRHTGAVFFDLEKAYDTTWRYGILRKVFQLGIRGALGIFSQNFLAQRVFRVRIGNQFSVPYTQVNGVPQGSVLSVALCYYDK